MTSPRTRSVRASHAAAAPPLLWLDGKPAAIDHAHLSALDRGFTLGDGLFETVRLYRGAAFRLERHLERLAHGAERLRLSLPPELRHWLRDAIGHATRAGLEEASLRLTVSRGIGAPGLAASESARPTCTVIIRPIADAGTPPLRGLSARIVAARRNELGATAGLKTTSYVESIVALADARAAGADEALLLDIAGHLCEASASNVFVVRARTLITPPRSCGILPGITRDAVIELAGTVGCDVEERPVAPAELHDAHEAFLTSSLREIAPVVRVDDRPVGTDDVGPITRRIRDAFEALVARECP